jgi:septum formation protein
MSGASPLLLASTSPQRSAILRQLGLPFDVVAPRYVEEDGAASDPVALVRAHARGKARSVEVDAEGQPVLGVDTAVVLDGAVFGKPADKAAAGRMLEALSGRRHAVVSGLCLVADGREFVADETTLVTFRDLRRRERDAYLATREWEGRAGGYAIQGRGAALVERIDGDYLNVVGLPAALLVRALAEQLPARYGFG